MIEDKQLNKRLCKRARKIVRKRRIERIERQIEMILQNEYPLIGRMMSQFVITKYRRELNRRAWKSERLFLDALTKKGIIDFWTNYPMLNRFFADVYFPSIETVVELDGSIHEKDDIKKKDERKDYWLKRFNYKIFRYKIITKEDADEAVTDLLSRIDSQKLLHLKHTALPLQLLKPPKQEPTYLYPSDEKTLRQEFYLAMNRDKSA